MASLKIGKKDNLPPVLPSTPLKMKYLDVQDISR